MTPRLVKSGRAEPNQSHAERRKEQLAHQILPRLPCHLLGNRASEHVPQVRVEVPAPGRCDRRLREDQFKNSPALLQQRPTARERRNRLLQNRRIPSDSLWQSASVGEELDHRHRPEALVRSAPQVREEIGEGRLPAQLPLLDEKGEKGRGHRLSAGAEVEAICGLHPTGAAHPPQPDCAEPGELRALDERTCQRRHPVRGAHRLEERIYRLGGARDPGRSRSEQGGRQKRTSTAGSVFEKRASANSAVQHGSSPPPEPNDVLTVREGLL